MSRSPRARRWILGGLPVLIVFAPPIWSQFVERAEFQRFHQDALREIIRKRNLDPAAAERVRKALQPGVGTDGLWDKNRAGGRFEVRRQLRVDPQPELFARSSQDFVDSLSSIIRRLSILDQIGPGPTSSIGQAQLQAYLRDTMKVTDYEQVANHLMQHGESGLRPLRSQ